jgi:hypothetical protein
MGGQVGFFSKTEKPVSWSTYHWRERSRAKDDVIFFPYAPESLEKSVAEVFIWDIDKTYLDTQISSLSSLMITALERAYKKKNVPGTQTLLQVLSKRWTERKGQAYFPIYFISASPPQLEERIFAKFYYDGIKPFGCFYKDNLKNLWPKRWWRLTKQVGYKIQALMILRRRLPEEVRQVCWGDDSESDAVIYNLYSDICARRMSIKETRQILRFFGVLGEQIDQILELQASVPEQDPVEKIYINLAEDTDPDYYLKFGRRTLPTQNSFQTALDLVQDRRLLAEDAFTVARDMIYNYRFSPEEIVASFDDFLRQRRLGAVAYRELLECFLAKGLFPRSYQAKSQPPREKEFRGERVIRLEGQFEPWVADHIDYTRDYR